MTPEHAARLVARWVRLYTRELPTPVAEERIDEIGADLHDHIAHGRARGSSDRRIALSILSRMLRGLAADASWRGQQAKASRKRRTAARPAIATTFVLLLPLLGMLITDEVAWGPADFVVAGALVFGTGVAYELMARRTGEIAFRAGIFISLAAAFILVWMMGAVGIIGEDGDPADLMYLGVLAVGIVGAVVARLQPEGMARALLATALAQALVAAIALVAGKHQAPISSAGEIIGLNGFFVALFIGSALLFRRAARRRPPADAKPQP